MASRSKQTEIHPPTPKLQGGLAIAGVAVEAELFFAINTLWWICKLLSVSEGMLHWFTQYIRHSLHFNQNTISKRAVYWPYWYELGGGVKIFCLFREAIYERACTNRYDCTLVVHQTIFPNGEWGEGWHEEYWKGENVEGMVGWNWGNWRNPRRNWNVIYKVLVHVINLTL